jgi:signal transduction histidine kinase
MIGKSNIISNTQNIAMVIHDIASPITLIRLNLDLLEYEMSQGRGVKTQSPTVKKYIKRAIIGVEKVSKIINYTMDSQYRNYNQETFNVKTELTNVINTFEIRSINERVELNCCIDNKIKIAGSKNAFHRVFGNLIGNALDAYSMCKGKGMNEKRIKVKAYKSGKYFIITFEDRAGGIPKTIQNKLFKEQYTTKSRGNGLGLISIKTLVEEHFRGFINCYSVKGQGTVFAIALPISPSWTSSKL